MFELEHRHIAALTDADLRTLVGKLCERHLHDAALPESAVTYGGDQRAADGGIDVRVDLSPDAGVEGWVPRPQTVLQVKQEKNGLRPAAITAEMRPKGTPRPLFAELASKNGAYIIVSGMETLSDEALTRRRQAMEQAIADVSGAQGLLLDFYDGHRIARWANAHHGVAHWVRHRIREPLEGWRPFGDWTATPQPAESEYLLDDQGRVFDGSDLKSGGLAIVEGLERIRTTLARSGTAVRLVGLSGMGKTRLVQALFDGRVGTGALDPALAVYGDAGGVALDPPPQHMLARLLRDSRRAVLIVDNCLPSLHAALAAELRAAAGAVSLITVEYDVGDDEHEGTEVFRLEPASDAVIKQLIAGAYPHIAEPDRRRIAELSDGNARLALALAATVTRGDSVAHLSQRDFFNRLFHQRHDRTGDQALLRAAEACALVYSFDSVTVDGETAELPLLAELAGQTVMELHRHVRTLLDRQLVQKRDRWRAVLPQALAIHLARQALETLPTALLRRAMEECAPPRLLKSFTRRLGYLHDSEAAQDIVAAWLVPGGRLHDASQPGRDDWAMFENVAPVHPDLALDAIEAAADREGDVAFFAENRYHRSELVHLLHALAYEPETFGRAAWLMIRALATEAPDNNHYSGRHDVESLFALYLSGTHASQADRLQLIDRLLQHPEPRFNEIGVMALGAMLNAGHFSSWRHSSFGARSRDYGWRPKTLDEQADWYRAALARAVSLADPASQHAQSARSMFAKHFRMLRKVPLLAGDADAAVRTVAAHGFWPEAWKAVCMTIRFDHERMEAGALAALMALEADLRPTDLVQRTRAYVLSEGNGHADAMDTEMMTDRGDYSSARKRLTAKVRELGRSAAVDDDALDVLLPELVIGKSGTLHIFGRSLGEASPDIGAMWGRLVAAFTTAPVDRRNAVILTSFLATASVRDAGWSEAVLDGAVTDPVLGPCFAFLQSAVFIGEGGVERLRRALATGLAPIATYETLGWCDAGDGLSDENLAGLLNEIACKPSGIEVALEALFFRLYRARDTMPGSVSPALITAGRGLLRRYDVSNHRANDDYRLSEMVKVCLSGTDAVDPARSLCRAIAGALLTSWQTVHDFQDTALALASLQPGTFLDVFVGNERDDATADPYRFSHRTFRNPLLAIPKESLLAWADGDPAERIPRIAAHLGPFERIAFDEVREDDGSISLAATLLDHAPDKAAVLTAFEPTLMPSGWSGNLSDELESRRKRLSPLLAHTDAAVKAWAEEANRTLAKAADAARRDERDRARREQSFE